MLRSLLQGGLCAVLFVSTLLEGQGTPAGPSTVPPQSAEVVVSATKLPEDPIDVAGPVEIISGEQLRRSGTKTIAEAIQDVVGVDTGVGSDNGAHLAGIGLWGLKEFDALLITVDGVPVGGPFNPSLSQINVEDVDRIEIVKGPQGTLYGVSAFAGMIQVFTRRKDAPGGTVSLGFGSFGEKRASLGYATEVGADLSLRVFGSGVRSDGWQDRTDYSSDRLTLSGQKRWSGGSTLDVSVFTYRDTDYFGSPLPVDGDPVPGFEADRNYAIQGSRHDHRVYGLSSELSIPLTSTLKLQNTFGLTRDEQISIISFPHEFEGAEAVAEGSAIKPIETTLFDDVRLAAEFSAAGRHKLVAGAAVTWGRTTAEGIGFDFDLQVTPGPVVPSLEEITVGDNRSFSDRRTFFGIYVNDAWTPVSWLTFTAGARFDSTSEALSVRQQEVGTPSPDIAEDSRSDGAFSGGISALVRIVEKPAGPLDALSAYVSLKSAFKPAAPNLSEAESARILDPERTRSGEFGIKSRWLDRQISFDASFFHMNFENLVVAVPDASGAPSLTNAGEERFQGMELNAGFHPRFAKGLSLSAGFANHDATFVRFSFFNAEGALRVVDGRRLELVPRNLWNIRLAYAPELGPGAFVAIRHQGQRPLNRRNTVYTEGFFETDAGVSYAWSWGRLALVGRNLGDDRHYIADSEIGDSQFYVAPPRRFLGELTIKF
ncbi:MAG: TonB-dependent receptor [Thermoanaerobaculia bacterium]